MAKRAPAKKKKSSNQRGRSGMTPRELVDQIAQSPAVVDRLDSLGTASALAPLVLDHVADAGQPLYAAMVAERWLTDAEATEKPAIVWLVCPHVKAQEVVHGEIDIWGLHDALFLPENEWAGFEEAIPDPESAAERLATLRTMWEQREAGKSQVVVVAAHSLAEATPKPGSLNDSTRMVRVGEELDMLGFASELVEAGFEKSPQVFARGQYAVRGGILDVFSWHAQMPVRLEWFGDEIDSIREFDADEQTSVAKLEEAEILLSESDLTQDAILADFIDPETDLVVTVEGDAGASDHAIELASVRITSGAETPHAAEDFLAACHENPVGTFDAGDFILQDQKRADFAKQMAEWQGAGWTVAMVFNSQGEIDRFTELVYSGAVKDGFLQTMFGTLSRGFTIPDARVAVLSDAEIFGRYQNQRMRRRYQKETERRIAQRQADITEFSDGDMVVHADYGIAIFRGIVTRETDSREGKKEEEVLELEYRDESRLYVPLDQAHLVSRYIGAGGKAPLLSKLGDKKWGKMRNDAQKSILDYAARLLRVQAERQTERGYAHPPDNKWQWEFENAFIYKETPDQMRAIEAAKADMESDRPMDRLICGDVGFGKTEIAIRAAFKAVMSGKQVAFLAPTTVLAQQHYQNLRERFSDFPIKVSLLNRFRTPAQQRKTVEGLANGSVDVCIGTHRLISKDIQYHDLGLAIIDEEQRFGVTHKERFKEIFQLVDVLTLSATPIPRTLYLSLLGVKDMSTIETPPPNRHPVATTVCPYDERTIRTAINKEVARKGQVYVLHNRVKSIQAFKKKIEMLCPGVRVAVGHGQMDQGVLAEIMTRFIKGEFDVLIATTIIESGVDIPNANTIIIDRADRFGLADLYQLRGRVGRSDRRAYAYLMLPRDMLTVGDARKRINAIKQYSSLGAGFKIAMRDLEIRGAGNLLGTQQSGHIAAIGFDLYCQLLKQSVSKLKGEAAGDRVDISMRVDFLATNEHEFVKAPKGVLPAFLPDDYMPEAKLRVTAYRQLAESTTVAEIKALRAEWTDRFGTPPRPADQLLLATELKIRAARAGVQSIEIKEGKLMMMKNGKYLQTDRKFPRLTGNTPAKKLKSALELVATI